MEDVKAGQEAFSLPVMSDVLDREGKWLERLVSVGRLSVGEAAGIGLELWFRSGGEAIPYKRPETVFPLELVPVRYRKLSAVRAALAVAKYPAGTAMTFEDVSRRVWWVPTRGAGELLDLLAEARRDQSGGTDDDCYGNGTALTITNG